MPSTRFSYIKKSSICAILLFVLFDYKLDSALTAPNFCSIVSGCLAAKLLKVFKNELEICKK